MRPEIHTSEAATERGFSRGAVVQVGPAYDAETRARTRNDEITGSIGTIVAIAANGDLLLARGDCAADVPPADEWATSVYFERCRIVRCNCGHPPTPQPEGSCTTGYGYDAAGRSSCFACCNAADAARMADPATDRIFAYWTRDTKSGADTMETATPRGRITTWPGGELATVVSVRSARVGFPDVTGRRPTRYYLTARAPDGSRWVGTSPGPGMYARLRRAR